MVTWREMDPMEKADFKQPYRSATCMTDDQGHYFFCTAETPIDEDRLNAMARRLDGPHEEPETGNA